MIAVALVALLIFGGLGFMWISRKPTPPATYQPVMPPGGYGSGASGMGAMMRGGGGNSPATSNQGSANGPGMGQ
jgi:hypothetical protein